MMQEVLGEKRCLIVFFAGCAMASSALAATFPGAGGDLSSASAWGRSLPGTDETIVLNQSGTYTASADISFGQFQVTTGDPVTIDMRGRKVSVNKKYLQTGFNTAANAGYGFAPRRDGNVNVTILGGLWDFVNENHFYAAESGKGDTGGSVTISDGAVITNVYRFYYGEHSVNNSAVLDNAKVYARELNNWATGNHNLMEIRNGAEMHLSGFFESDNAGGNGPATGFNTIWVTGAGSRLNVTGTGDCKLGVKHQENSLIVADRARLDVAGTLKLGTADKNNGYATSNCVFTVENCATANVATVQLGAVNPNKGSKLNVLSGAVANISKLTVGPGGETCFNRIVVSNATLNVNALAYPSAASSRSNEFWVVDGGKLGGNAWASALNIGASYGNSFNIRNSDVAIPSFLLGEKFGGNAVTVAENGSLANTTTYCTIGHATPDNRVLVSNATWTITGAYIGSGGSRNVLTATSDAFVHVTASTGLVAGNGENVTSNRIEILNGARVAMDNNYSPLTIGQKGSFNEGLVDSACVTCGYVQVGADAVSRGNRLEIRNSIFVTGRVSVDANYKTDPFGAGSDNEFVLDHTDWDLGGHFRLSMTGSNNVMRLLNGSHLSAKTSTSCIGEKSTDSRNNILYVGADSSLDLIRFRMMALDSMLVVSNGTVSATDSGNGINLGYRENGVNMFTAGNALRLEGDRPTISTEGPVTFQNTARFEVALPETAFAEGHVPIRAKNLTFDATSLVKVTGDEFFKHGGRVVLAEVTGSISLPNAVVQASLADMPPRCRLFVSGKQLIFKAPTDQGMMLILR